MNDKFSHILNEDNTPKNVTDLEILGLPSNYFDNNDLDAFKKDVREVVVNTHPDKNNGSARSTEAFKVVHEAIKRIKKNFEQNGRYQHPGQEPRPAPAFGQANTSVPPYAYNFGFSQDFFSGFENMFSSFDNMFSGSFDDFFVNSQARPNQWEEDAARFQRDSEERTARYQQDAEQRRQNRERDAERRQKDREERTARYQQDAEQRRQNLEREAERRQKDREERTARHQQEVEQRRQNLARDAERRRNEREEQTARYRQEAEQRRQNLERAAEHLRNEREEQTARYQQEVEQRRQNMEREAEQRRNERAEQTARYQQAAERLQKEKEEQAAQQRALEQEAEQLRQAMDGQATEGPTNPINEEETPEQRQQTDKQRRRYFIDAVLAEQPDNNIFKKPSLPTSFFLRGIDEFAEKGTLSSLFETIDLMNYKANHFMLSPQACRISLKIAAFYFSHFDSSSLNTEALRTERTQATLALHQRIEELKTYAQSKNQALLLKLCSDLEMDLNRFINFSQALNEFKCLLLTRLHSQDDQLQGNKALILIANILIACLSLGLAHLIQFAQVKHRGKGSVLFFGQTKAQEKVADVEAELGPSAMFTSLSLSSQ